MTVSRAKPFALGAVTLSTVTVSLSQAAIFSALLAGGLLAVIATASAQQPTVLAPPQASPVQLSPTKLSPPSLSASQLSAPQLSAPQLSAPQLSAPQLSAPMALKPPVALTRPGQATGEAMNGATLPATSPAINGSAGSIEPVPGSTTSGPATPAPVTGGALPAAAQTFANDGSAIQVDTLGRLDLDAAGSLTTEQGGLGVDMWAGTQRALVERLLPHLPIGAPSPAMRDLLRRLLLTAAKVPEGKSSGISLVALRAQLLSDMGDLTGVTDLLEATPARHQIDQLVRMESDLRFLANDNARACALAAGQIGKQTTSYWQKAFIFCQALAGEHDKASLGVSLLNEMGDTDEIFSALIFSMSTGTKATIESLPDPSPLQLAMARVAKAPLPSDVVSSDRPGILRTISSSPNAPVELRLEAAERAEAAGALPVESLRQLYTSVSFTDEDLANPLSRTEAETGPMSRALLYRTALVQTVPAAQTEAVSRALKLGREGGRYASTVRAFMPVLLKIAPSTDLSWFAPEAVSALMVSNQFEAANDWLGLLKANALFNKDSAKALAELWPLVHLAGVDDAAEWKPERVAAWWQTIQARQGSRDRAAMMYTLLERFGEPVSPELWSDLLAGPDRSTIAMPHAALWHRLRTAAQGRRVGETVLLALMTLGEGGPAQSDPVILSAVLSGLIHVGLENEARRLAVEAMVAGRS